MLKRSHLNGECWRSHFSYSWGAVVPNPCEYWGSSALYVTALSSCCKVIDFKTLLFVHEALHGLQRKYNSELLNRRTKQERVVGQLLFDKLHKIMSRSCWLIKM